MTSVMNGRGGAETGVYSGFARFLHWTVAACVLTMIPIGILMNRIPAGVAQNVFYTMHRSLGVLVLALMLVRLTYRIFNGAPAPEPTITPLQRIASQLVHLSLYALLITQAVIGWVATWPMARRYPSSACSPCPRSWRRTRLCRKRFFPSTKPSASSSRGSW